MGIELLAQAFPSARLSRKRRIRLGEKFGFFFPKLPQVT
jgi:hypothetical protein